MWQKMKKMKKILVQKLYHNGIIRETGETGFRLFSNKKVTLFLNF